MLPIPSSPRSSALTGTPGPLAFGGPPAAELAGVDGQVRTVRLAESPRTDSSRVVPEPPPEAVPIAARQATDEGDLLALNLAVRASVDSPVEAARVMSCLNSALKFAVLGSSSPDQKSSPLRVGWLDLSALGPAAAGLSREVGECLDRLAAQDGVALGFVILPPHLERVPPALGGLSRLTSLTLRNFQGTTLDLRGLRSDGGAVEVLGTAERLIEIRRGPNHDLKLSSRSYLRVREWVHPLPGGDSGPAREPAAGTRGDRFYARVDRADHADAAAYLADHAGTLSRHLNGKARFTGAHDPIVCRHLALAVMHERLKWEAGAPGHEGRRGRFEYRKFSSPEAIAQTIGPEWDRAFDKVYHGSVDNHLVALPELGRFLDSRFRSMSVGQSRQFLLCSGNHAMNLRLRRKAGPDGTEVRVITVYDPNTTTTHFRKAFAGSGPLDFNLAQALGPRGREAVESYFGPDARNQVAVLQDVSLDTIEDALSGTSPAQAAGRNRQIDVFRPSTGAGSRCTPREVYLRRDLGFVSGLEAPLLDAVTEASDDRYRLALLRGEFFEGPSAWYTALRSGQSDWVHTVLRVADRAKLSRGARIELLAVSPGVSRSPLASLIAGHALAGLDLYFEVIKTLGLDAQAITSLLATPNAEGKTPLDLAMAQGAEVTARFVQGVLSLDGNGFDCRTVLAVRGDGGRGSFGEAIKRGDTEAVGGFLRSVLASGLDEERMRELLLLAPGDRWVSEQLAQQPAMATAWAACLDQTVHFGLSLDLAVVPSDLDELDAAKMQLNMRGRSLDRAIHGGSLKAGSVQPFVHQLHLTLSTDGLASDKAKALAFGGTDGRPLLHRLMAANAYQHVEALGLAMRLPAFRDSWGSLLEGRATQAGTSAFSVAVKGDNMLAIEAWMQQVLPYFQDAGLPAEERERILLGLPPGATQEARTQAIADLRAAPLSLAVWTREVARATPQQIDPAMQRRLMTRVGQEQLLEPLDAKADRTPATGR